ncbi:MAG: c-type cytochrome [Nevskiaceae bacterium]
MNPEHHDKTFVATFLVVLGILGAFTVTIWIVAHAIGGHEPTDVEAHARIQERIRPLGQVVTDASQLLAMAAPAQAARAPLSADEVITKVCAVCHGTGVLDAPKIGDTAEWNKRKAAGMGALVANSIQGKNQMPARGGDPSLTDDEVKAAVEQMLKQSGA